MASLRPYQEAHYHALLRALMTRRSALDASDTGTGKTYVALFICKALGVTPLVVGTLGGRGGWEAAAKAVGVDIEYVNYDKVRGRRKNGKPSESDWIIEQPWGKGSFLRWKNNYYFVIFDEVHRCGGASTLNSKLLIAAKRQAQYILCLSATAADDPRQMKALGYALGLHGISKKTPETWMNWQLRQGLKPGVFGGFDLPKEEEKQRAIFKRLNEAIFPLRGSRMRKSEIPSFPKTSIDVKLLADDSGEAAKIAEKIHAYNKACEASGVVPSLMEEHAELEMLKVPYLADLARDYAETSRVIIFLNFTEPLRELARLLDCPYIDGSVEEYARRHILNRFQQNKDPHLVCNTMACGESMNAHDPTGQIERTALISPCPSGRQFKQVVGRVNRDGGAFSQQFVCLFKNTKEESIADNMLAKGMNVDLFNDATFLC